MLRRGQTTLEYFYIIGVALAALIVVAVYMKRGFQGQWRGFSDTLGDQYSPGNTEGAQSFNVSTSSSENITGSTTTNNNSAADDDDDSSVSTSTQQTNTTTSTSSSRQENIGTISRE